MTTAAPTSPADLDEERLARLTLSLVFEPGDPRATRLCAELGGRRLLAHLREDRAARDVTTDAGVRLPQVRAHHDLERAARLGVRFVIPGDPDWPSRLDALASAGMVSDRGGPPFGLWVRGSGSLAALDRSLAVVGSRAATSYGLDVAARLSADVATEGWVVISGGAYGIDQAAHRGALATAGVSVAVLANGLDRTYPAGNARLVDALTEDGLAISELAPGCAPSRIRFLARNRVIAALAHGTVVVEAALRSGALNTANWTGRLHRHLMAVPGPVTSIYSAGAHELVRAGAAVLVTDGGDVLEVVGRAGEHLTAHKRGPERPRDKLSRRQQQVLDAVPVGESAATDAVARTAGVGLVETRGALDRLEAVGLVRFADTGWRLTELALT